MLKYNPGALLLAGAVSGGWGWYDADRPINFPGFFALAQSEHDVGYVNGRLRAAYQLGAGSWYLKPMVDLGATHVRLDGVNETGAGAVGLIVRGAGETVLSATPALELGAQFGAAYGTLVRPYLRGGATFYDDPDFVLLASFEGSPGSVGPFRIASSTDDVVGTVGRRRRDRRRRGKLPALLLRKLRRPGRSSTAAASRAPCRSDRYPGRRPFFPSEPGAISPLTALGL